MNSEVVLDKRLLDWLRQRVDLACDLSESLETMRKQGLSDETIIAAIDAVRPRGDALADGAPSPPLIRRHPPNLHKVDNPNLDLYTLDNFLSAKECARL